MDIPTSIKSNKRSKDSRNDGNSRPRKHNKLTDGTNDANINVITPNQVNFVRFSIILIDHLPR